MRTNRDYLNMLLSYDRNALLDKNRQVGKRATIGGIALGIALAIFTGNIFGGDDQWQ